ncbi:MAG: Eco57I restriction-modification methylase domain-containing protein [Deltaproteobacteria bacterium]|nr:Eco57I restriction-modification methylase domain-containing protein [Deltaproteobacteria bacterium]
MTLSVSRIQHYLKSFKLEKMFIEELGWDYHFGKFLIEVDGISYTLSALAEKRGVQIFTCSSDADGQIPDYATRRKIEKQVTKSAYEHLIIFIDDAKTMQIWQWVSRQPGLRAAFREHHYLPAYHSGESLIQKLTSITFSLGEEEGLDLTGVAFKLRDAFDRDKITKRFYDHFKKQHGSFLGFIQGITQQGDREWYASLMLNRLMFIYFIQRKEFLDGDLDYLKNRLKMVRERKGEGKFLSFYRYFLLRLFHEGFAQQPKQRKKDLEDLLGTVPYLNGGLFELHELEREYPKINIPDEAFEKLFAFFDQYEWHLDNRPLCNDKEINPDVLGYIFEKFINQKQMGAYYTKEDITEYISKNTVIPYLFDAARKKCAVAFQPDASLWGLLKNTPLRYIYPAMTKGVIDTNGDVIPLPGEIAKGIDDVAKREGWNKPADAEYALPTETWREHVARRQRCIDIIGKISKGKICRINNLITYNLDIRQFIEDAITECEGPELLRAFYQAISTVTVLDPTCGSGAFLFAALNILEPIYDACLDRMQGFVDDLDRSGEPHRPEKFSDFRRILKEIDRHPNRRFFVLKSIVVNNLYGVDIMEEAVEICKLRLFLKLVAQVDKVKQLEPLPDIDFNIRAGNTLVGFVAVDEIRKAAEITSDGQKQILFSSTKDEIKQIEEDAGIVELAFKRFHQMQTKEEMDAQDFKTAKEDLRERLKELSGKLDQYLAKEYGIDLKKKKAFEDWRSSHQPFHWLVEFYGIMGRGGFDVIIGNPPYLERSKLKNSYRVIGYKIEKARDIYAWVVERTKTLCGKNKRLGLIVPVSIVSSASFDVLRDIISEDSCLIWFSHFANRPGQLFSGAQNRLSIFLTGTKSDGGVFSTCYHRWSAKKGERDKLFSVMQYTPLLKLTRSFHGLYPKVGNSKATSIINKIQSNRVIANLLATSSKFPIHWVRVPGYFCQFFLNPPMVKPENGGPARIRGEVNSISLSDETKQRVLHSILNSSTYFLFFCAYTDGRHINPSDVKSFPFDYRTIRKSNIIRLVRLSKDLEHSMHDSTSYWRKSGLLIESVNSRPTKIIIDKIDAVIVDHYGLTKDELDYIINYDIKYRIGQ